MIELPEAKVIARQIKETLKGKRIEEVVAANTPHKFAWYFEDPKDYQKLLSGKYIDGSSSFGGFIEISAEDCRILLGEGVKIKYYEKGEKLPVKHQLMITFDDGSAMVCSVQMYGGMWCFREGKNQDPYYKVAKEKPSPFSVEFNEYYFLNMLDEDTKGLSLKAFLATQQRIPGFGNGILQDILWNAKLHPKRKMNSLEEADLINLFKSIKATIGEMVEKGGRDTEKDLFGINGGYKTVMSSKNEKMLCPICCNDINKESYLGGSIYYCSQCQPFIK
ncbi:DNA-formamidopyrimidine glycosylase family protein [Lutispora thermophila]|uniref:Formamidopyrimidine-DNA glycosylase n=1 Tax=Lutispora thermophila DSM 19022 TaxID=1122184 RepID=A0A1M6E4D1_9FIRM|nr:DNA-formamidopyrimidine glycosylase family protein [Lutispora thermophila]SHI80108.1 formamidopyrimidine-DNA glycosylase [Lutispora thermophila DSM 19022]